MGFRIKLSTRKAATVYRLPGFGGPGAIGASVGRPVLPETVILVDLFSNCGLERMPDRYSLKTCFPVSVLPGNVQNIRMRFADDHLQTFQQITFSSDRFAIDPSSVRHDGFLGRQDPLDGVKSNMSLRRAAAGRYLIFQKNSQDLDALQFAI